MRQKIGMKAYSKNSSAAIKNDRQILDVDRRYIKLKKGVNAQMSYRVFFLFVRWVS